MPAERFFVDQDLVPDSKAEIAGKEHHHMVHVVRIRAGDAVELVNGRGQLATAEVIEAKKNKAEVLITRVASEKKPAYDVILAQAIPRHNRLDFIVEKGTELGMTRLWLFPAELSERKKLSAHQLERVRQIMIAATKQCGRLHLPEFAVKPPLSKWSRLPSPSLFGDIRPDAPGFWQMMRECDLKSGGAFFIGPESGFTDKELAALDQLGARGVNINPNILRTDTAALTSLSLLMTALPAR